MRLLLGFWAVLLAAATGVVLGLAAKPGVGGLRGAVAGGGGLGLGAARAELAVLAVRGARRRPADQPGVLWQAQTVVPYGRMQLVEVTSGPLERRFGLASVQLHTAAAATDAKIPGLVPGEAERLRDRLTELGEARSAGL